MYAWCIHRPLYSLPQMVLRYYLHHALMGEKVAHVPPASFHDNHQRSWVRGEDVQKVVVTARWKAAGHKGGDAGI